VSFLRLALAALAVAVWFAGWALGARRIIDDTGPLRFRVEMVEAMLLTAFATLWFASLGHGGWWLLFAVLGLLIEGPIRFRQRAGLPADPAPVRSLLLGTLRLLGAGLVLSLLL
jgi:hypothetical protein